MRVLAGLVLLALVLPLAQPLAAPLRLGPRPLAFPQGPPNDPNYDRAEESPLDYAIFDEQWNLFSFLPASTPLARASGETASGISADMAWRTTIGRPDVRIAVLDSGIYWEDRELLNKVALNTAELPLPQGCASYDCDGNGVVDVRDYAGDPRVHDQDANGQRDAGDLILAFSDGVDQDHNAYTDDIAGWDFFRDDNNPYDEVRFGHGTGEAKGSSAETDNGIGGAGVCPLCRVVPLRIGDSFVVHGQEFAQAVMYAVDNGIDVVQSAVGEVNWDAYTQRVLDDAWSHGTIVILSAADEDSFHHNYPGALEHTIVTKSVQPDSTDEPDQVHALQTTSYQTHAACTNWGAHITLASPSTSCSSGATEILSGVAGLVASRAKDLGLHLSAAQAKQVLLQGADDIAHAESAVPLRYPSQPGFDAYFGYGRTNASRSVGFVSPSLPEVDIQEPRWFEPIRWQPGMSIPIEGRVAFPSASLYHIVVEVAPGVQPTDDQYTTLRDAWVDSPEQGALAVWSPQDAPRGPAQGSDDFTYTLRVRVEDGLGHRGEDRKAVGLYQDPTLRARVDLRSYGSLEGSPALADLDGDGALDIVQADGGGHVHALHADGAELAGWPVSADVFAPALAHALAPGFARDGVPLDGFVASPAVGDLDSDGSLEVVAASLGGNVYVWHADGTRAARFGVDRSFSDDPTRTHDVRWGFLASPALADLGRDGHLDIIDGAYDQHLYAWNGQGQDLPGFPALLTDPASPGPFDIGNEIVSSPAVADLDGDGWLDIVVGTNEVYAEPKPLPP
ncbi:MAG: S8 family serine peptidase, partial [Halobacteriales archaeon]|nr:S8 family serine peptidase [Halobacteriales archaeon]